MPDLLGITPQLRDGVVGLILRGTFRDDPAENVVGALAQLRALQPVPEAPKVAEASESAVKAAAAPQRRRGSSR